MRALHFAKPKEYRLEIFSDPLVQGQAVEGTLELLNRGGETLQDCRLEVALAFAVYKELKAEGRSAMEILQRLELLTDFSLEPGASRKVPFEFALGLNFPVHGISSGPFLLYGGGLGESGDNAQGDNGQIDLPVKLSTGVESFIGTFENHHAFLAGESRYNNGMLEIRFKPPSTHPTLVELFMQMELGAEEVRLFFKMHGKSLVGGSTGGVTSRKVELVEEHPTKEFFPGSNLPNRGLYREIWQRVVDALVPPRMG